MSKSKCAWSALKKSVSPLLASVFLFLLFAVSPSYAVTHGNGDAGGTHSIPVSADPVSQAATVLFIDSGVQDAQALLTGVAAGTDIIRLQGDSDGVQQIAAALKRYRNLDSIQIVSHGAPGQLALGSASLTGANLDRYQTALQAWGGALKARGDILLYGCNVAQGAAGDRFVNRIAALTGGVVAASTDATGSAALGGNGLLEKKTGRINANHAIADAALLGYNHLLASIGATNTVDFNVAGAGWIGLPGIGTDTLSPVLTNSSFTFTYADGGGTNIWGVGNAGSGGTPALILNGWGNPAETLTIVHSTPGTTFKFTSFFVNTQDSAGALWGEGSWTVTGYLNNVSQGTQTINTGAFGVSGAGVQAVQALNANTNLQNVDKIVITSSASGGFVSFLDTFVFDPAVPPPTVTAIAPTSGSTAGGTAVTITGTNFTGATAVTVGGAAATSVVVVNATTITAVTPAGTAGAQNVAVTVPGGTGTGTGLFTYVAAPTVTAISPTSGTTMGGTAVTITGTNLTGATAVTIGGVAATSVVVVSATSITAVTPAGTAGAKDVVVTTPSGTGTGTGLFTYVAAPTVTAISPTSGTIAGGTAVIISGTNFTGATAVTIGGVAATGITVVSATSITAVTPAGTAGAQNVVVTTPGGTGTGTGLFTYVTPTPAPTVTAISPTSGPTAGGTAVTITGTNLSGATSVTIGGAAATSVVVVNATTITAVTPAGTAGTAGAQNVVVTTPGGTGTGTGLFTYVATPAPTVTAISPTNGTTAGGTAVTITGTNLTGATSVTIGGAAATSIVVVNATTITATTPAGTVGAQNVVVTTSGGTGTGTGLFTYNPSAPSAPTITGITPGNGQLSVAFTAGATGGSVLTNYEYSTNGGGAFTAVSPAATTSPIVITGLTNGITYPVQIRAVNAMGTGIATASTSATPNPVVNGACGIANGVAIAYAPAAANLCTTGSASAVTNASPWSWTCAGSGGGGTASCSAPNASTATGSGSGRFSITASSGATAWQVQSVNFVSVASTGASAPAGYSFPHGLLDLRLNTGTAGSSATVILTYPAALPTGTVYWKYGRTAANPVAHWYQFPGAVIAGNTITLTLTDGADGDDDLTANSLIVDPGGPGAPLGAGGVTGVPTLSQWGQIILAALLALLGVARMRRRESNRAV